MYYYLVYDRYKVGPKYNSYPQIFTPNISIYIYLLYISDKELNLKQRYVEILQAEKYEQNFDVWSERLQSSGR